MAPKPKRRRPARPRAGWLAACWGWLADLLARKGAVKDAAATAMVGELLDRSLDNVDGC